MCKLLELLPDLCPAVLIQLPRREKQILIMPRHSNPAHLQVTQLCSGAGHNLCPPDHKPQSSELSQCPRLLQGMRCHPHAHARGSQPFCQPGIPRCTGWVCSKFTSTPTHQRTLCRKSPEPDTAGLNLMEIESDQCQMLELFMFRSTNPPVLVAEHDR